jgi:hypothetical protein
MYNAESLRVIIISLDIKYIERQACNENLIDEWQRQKKMLLL